MTTPTTQVLGEAERRRIEEVDLLAARGPEAIDELLARLTDPSWVVRRAVVAALAGLGDDAVEPLADVLRHRRDDEARLAAAVDALVASTGSSEDAAVALTHHANPAVVADGAQILGRRRSRRHAAVLRQLVSHADDNVAVAAIEALGRMGGRTSVEALVEAAGSGNFFRVFPALDVLGRSGDPRVVAPLADLLQQPYYAPEAARALGRSGERAAAGPLMGLLTDGPEVMVRVAAVALAELLERHADRHGREEPVVAALAAHPRRDVAARRLERLAPEADPVEQADIARVLGALGAESSVPVLGALLEGTPAVAAAASAALRRVGHDADAELLAALREGGSERRLVLLPLVRNRSAAPAVAELLDDPSPEVRVAAAETLARLGHPDVAERLFGLLGDRDPRVVQAAVGAIQSLGSRGTEALAIQAVRSGDRIRRRAALMILAYFGYPAGFELFLEALSDEDPRVRDTALQGLAFLEDPRALEAILDAARTADPRTRSGAVRALGQTGGEPRVVSLLLRALSDPDAWVRYYACQSLGRLNAESAAGPVAALLEDPAPQVRVAAVEALSHLREPAALGALRRAAAADDPEVRRAALLGLGITRQADAVPTLADAARSPDPSTRLVALSSLAGFPGAESVAVIAEGVRDPDETVRAAAVGFLSSRPGPEPTRALAELLSDPDQRPRALAALAQPSPGRIRAILELLETADDETAAHLVSALGRIARPGNATPLLEAMHMTNPAARRAAAPAVAALDTEEARQVLKACAATDPDAEVRRISTLLLAD